MPFYTAEAKARQATSTGGTHPQLVEVIPQAADAGRARDHAAKRVGGPDCFAQPASVRPTHPHAGAHRRQEAPRVARRSGHGAVSAGGGRHRASSGRTTAHVPASGRMVAGEARGERDYAEFS
jgi:hypothetical protein